MQNPTYRRTPFERKRDRAFVAKHLALRKTISEITDLVNLTFGYDPPLVWQTIQKDVRAIEKVYHSETLIDYEAYRKQEEARYVAIETEALEQWELSKRDRTTESQKIKGKAAKGSESVDKVNEVEKSKTVERREGDPQFLRLALDAVDRRIKLMGVSSPVRHEITGKGGAPLVDSLPDMTSLPDDQLIKIIETYENAKRKQDK